MNETIGYNYVLEDNLTEKYNSYHFSQIQYKLKYILFITLIAQTTNISLSVYVYVYMLMHI